MRGRVLKCGLYFIDFDRCGFPLVRRYDWDCFIGLFPVSKYQFERFVRARRHAADGEVEEWYAEALELNPWADWHDWKGRPWELLLTGLNAERASRFLSYLGADYRLPTVRERRALLRASGELRARRGRVADACREAAAEPAVLWLERQLGPLAAEGVLELVVDDDTVRCMGRPWQGLLPNTWRAESVRDVNWEVSRRLVGFRPVCPSDGMEADC